MTEAFTEYLMRVENLLIVAAVWVVMSTLRRVWPELGEHHLWARFSPVMPLVLCSAAVWIPGVVDGTPGMKVLLGIVLGAMSANAHKIFKQTALGRDQRIKRRRESL